VTRYEKLYEEIAGATSKERAQAILVEAALTAIAPIGLTGQELLSCQIAVNAKLSHFSRMDY